MKPNHIAAAVLTLVLPLLVACANWGGVSSSWQGRSLDQLVTVWGPPQSIYEMDDGGKVVSFAHQRFISGNSYYCTATFNINPSNRITSSSIDGNLGGCNVLVGDKYAP